MAIIEKIPKQFRAGLKILAEMDESSFQSLKELVQESPIVFSPKNLARSIGSYSIKNIQSILQSVGSLIIVRERREVSTSELVQDVCRIYTEEENLDKTDIALQNTLNQRLAELLNNEKLFLSAKPLDILSEYENIFLSGRLITDIRPVFGSDIEEDPKAAMIIHNFRIHYRRSEEEEHKDIYFALTGEDIKDLKKMLERAEKKARTLKTFIERSKIAYLDPSEEE